MERNQPKHGFKIYHKRMSTSIRAGTETIEYMFYNYSMLHNKKKKLYKKLRIFVRRNNKVTCFPRYRRPRATGSRRIMGSALLQFFKTDMIDSAISSLQEPTNTNPKEMAENTKSTKGVWESLKVIKNNDLS